MNLLILTCNTGGGHNSAGKAIKDYFEARGHTCTIQDALVFLPKEEARLISQGHVFVYRHLPRLFGVGYRYEENHPPRLVCARCNRAAAPMYRYLQEHDYDAVLCAHVFPALMLTQVRRRYGLHLWGGFIATDYTCSPGVNQTDLDAYFIPRNLTDEFVRNGIPRDKLVESGIPVGERFYEKGDRAAARQALGLPQEGKLALLMCGSMGCGPMKELAALTARQLPPGDMLAVICGSNEKLQQSLTGTLPDNVRVVGFTHQMAQWMEAADVLMSKPGGLSSTEAMTRRLPLVCILAVPGCETRNMEYFTQYGYAVSGQSVEELSSLACGLLREPQRADHIRARLEQDFSRCAVAQIYKTMTSEPQISNERADA